MIAEMLACVCSPRYGMAQIASRGAQIPDDSIRTIRGHQLPPTCVALADDEKTAYTGSKDSTIIQCTSPDPSDCCSRPNTHAHHQTI